MLHDDLARVLIEEHPLDTARVLERLEPSETWKLLLNLEQELRAPIVEGFTLEYASRVLQAADYENLLLLIRDLPSEVSVDILERLPGALRTELLEGLPKLHAEEIENLSEYAEDTAGSVMSPEFVSLRAEATINDALTRLRRLALVGRNVNYVYVVDQDDHLKGVLVMRDLVLSKPSICLRDIMIQNVTRVYTTDLIDKVADVLMERKLLAVPVVDDAGILRGVISANQLVSELQEEGFEDAQKMFGAGEDETALSTPLFSIRKRFPWLSVNLATAFLAGAVVGVFDDVLARMTFLAAFLPIVAGQGGNSGAQALAVTLRSLALGEIDARRPRQVIAKEAFVGLANGLMIGLISALAAVAMSGKWVLGLVMLLAMMINLLVAGVSGAAIPIFMERLRQDPAQSSNILLTTVTDCVGYGVFLALTALAAKWLL